MKLKQIHYSWVMVILAVLAMTANAIVLYSFGIFLIPITTAFGWERGTLSAANSMTLLVSGVLAILAGRLCDKYGPRPLITVSGILAGAGYFLMSQISSLWHVYLIWGLIIGVSFACCTIPVTSTIPRWFTQRRGLALGLTMVGFGLGAMIWPPLSQLLISSYGWRQAYVVLGLISFIILIPVAQFMKHSPQRIGLRPYGENVNTAIPSPSTIVGGLSLKQAIKTSRFWIFGLTQFCFLFIVQIIIAHLAPYATDSGISAVIAASIVSIMGIVTIAGRLGIGTVADRVGPKMALTISFTLLTLAMIWLLFTGELWTFYVFAVIAGIAYGGESAVLSLVPADLFGLKYLGTIAAVNMLCGTIGAAIGMPLAGVIFDVTGSYHIAFLICVAFSILAIVLSVILLRSKSYEDIKSV
ncbi:MFS transporter [Chloroflexota bacterium]